MRGSLEPWILDTPRKRMEVPEPRLPELATMSRPAIRPCNASSTVVIESPSNSDILMLCCEVEISSTGIESPEPAGRFFEVIVTSLICVASCMAILNFVLLKGNVTVL